MAQCGQDKHREELVAVAGLVMKLLAAAAADCPRLPFLLPLLPLLCRGLDLAEEPFAAFPSIARRLVASPSWDTRREALSCLRCLTLPCTGLAEGREVGGAVRGAAAEG